MNVRLNDFSAFLRDLIACLHSSSNQGFLGLELVEDFGIVFSAICKRILEKSGIGFSDSKLFLFKCRALNALNMFQSACLNLDQATTDAISTRP